MPGRSSASALVALIVVAACGERDAPKADPVAEEPAAPVVEPVLVRRGRAYFSIGGYHCRVE